MRAKLVPVVVALSLVGVSCTRSAEGQLPTPEMISDVLPTITDMPGESRAAVEMQARTEGGTVPA